MKEQILKILKKYNKDLESDSYYSVNYGISEDNFEEITDEILELLTPKKEIKPFLTDSVVDKINEWFKEMEDPNSEASKRYNEGIRRFVFGPLG